MPCTSCLRPSHNREAPARPLLTHRFVFISISLLGELHSVAFEREEWSADHVNIMELVSYVMCFIGLLLVVANAAQEPSSTDDYTLDAFMYAPGILSLGVIFLFITGGMRLIEIVPRIGPLLSITWLMLNDVFAWLVLVLVPLVSMTLGLTFAMSLPRQVAQTSNLWVSEVSGTSYNLSTLQRELGADKGEQMFAYLEECMPILHGLTRVFPALLTLFQFAFGTGDVSPYTDCTNKHFELLGDPSGVIVFLAFGVIVIVMLLNMLIAMMAKTFDEVYGDSEAAYRFVLAIHTLTLADAAPVPPPLGLVWTLRDLASRAAIFGRKLQARLAAARRRLPPEVSRPPTDGGVGGGGVGGGHRGGSTAMVTLGAAEDGGREAHEAEAADDHALEEVAGTKGLLSLPSTWTARRGTIDWTLNGVDPKLTRRLEMAVYAQLGGADADLNDELETLQTQVEGIAGNVSAVHERVDRLDAKLDAIVELLQGNRTSAYYVTPSSQASAGY